MNEMNDFDALQAQKQAEEQEKLKKNGKSFSIAGMTLAIIGLVLAFLGGFVITALLSLPCAIVGLVLSVMGGKKLKSVNASRGMATAGLVVGIIATSISGIAFLTCGLCGLCALNSGIGFFNMLF